MGSILSSIVPHIAHLPYPGFDIAVEPLAYIPRPVLSFAKWVHIAHFAYRRINQVKQLERDPYACFAGSVLLQVNDSCMVQIAVKAALIARILFEIKDKVIDFQTAFLHVTEELSGDLPISAQFLIEETAENDPTQDIPWQVELYQRVPKPVAEVVYRFKWIVMRMRELLNEFIKLSCTLLDLYDGLVTAAGPLEYFQLLPNLSRLIDRLESEPLAFSQFVKNNHETFFHTCKLMKLEACSQMIVSILEHSTNLVCQTAKGMQKLISAGKQAGQDISAVVEAGGFA